MKAIAQCLLGVLAASMLPTAAHAGETTQYTYDALGRLVRVTKAGGPADGADASYSYDAASNRTNVTVTGASSGGSGNGGDGASTNQDPAYVVVPLNGYTLVRIK